jgi:4-amino-4-deoxy-L-arabinose transferase-like glycosyltransferase
MADPKSSSETAIHPSLTVSRTQTLWLCLIVILCLAPFGRKAFHVDDPLFIWAARHIAHHPLDPYGFTVNWNGTEEPMSYVTKNPPLCSYYLALAGSVLGWGELRLHAAMMIPAILAILGTFLLAAKLCDNPLEAALAALLTPVFLVSATSVMCDVMMLAFWVWAIFFWTRGIDEGKSSHLAAAAILTALCALTKYYGIVLVPLLLIYAIVKKRAIGAWALYLIIPPAVLAVYYLGTRSLYQRNLLIDAVHYATNMPHFVGEHTFTGIAFTGGCMAVAAFYALRLWSRKALLGWTLVTIAAITGLWFAGPVPGVINGFARENAPIVRVEMGIMFTIGLSIVLLAMLNLKRKFDAESLMLLLWVLGTFFFARFVNWSMNGRSVLPMAPAVGILIMRQWESRRKESRTSYNMMPLVLAGCLALAVTATDWYAARSARAAATQLYNMYHVEDSDLWFEGHWGFQYYMQELGAKPVDGVHSKIPKGSTIILPALTTQLVPIPDGYAKPSQMVNVPVMKWMAVLSERLGAGFYSSVFGPMPYVIAPQPPEPYFILTTVWPLEYPCEVPTEETSP